MQKFKVEDLKCYPQVAKVLGEHSAKVELSKVVNYKEVQWIIMESDDIVGCFHWKHTPQGYDFWSSVRNESLEGEYRWVR